MSVCARAFLVVIAMALFSESIVMAGAASFSDEQICKATIAAAFGRDPKIIKISKKEGGVIYLHYTRPDDGTKWAYRCKIEGNRVIWAADPGGRWRTHPADEFITYKANADSLEITQTSSDLTDPSKKEDYKQTYKRSQLK